MPSVKISQLPTGGALAGDELLPAVQAGDTVATTVAELRAGLAADDLSNVSNGDFATKAAAAGVSGGGGGGGADVGDAVPLPLGVAAAGAATAASREDHVHTLPTPADIAAAAAVHGHAIADTTGLQGALDTHQSTLNAHQTTLDAHQTTLNTHQSSLNAKLAQGKHTIWIPASAIVARGTDGADVGLTETTSNKVMVATLDFDTATAEHAQFTVAMPKSWDVGVVTYQAVWTADGGTGGVAWTLRALARSDDDPMDAAFGAAVTVTDTLIATGDLHITAESAAVTVGGSPAQGDVVVFQVSRSVADGADTLAQDARLIGVRLFHTLNAGNDA